MHLLCKCGYDMWNGQIPNDIEYTVFSDGRLDEICADDTIPTTELGLINDYNVWRCPMCGRLYVFKNESGSAGNEALFVYKPEEKL